MSRSSERPISIAIGQILTSQGNRGEVKIKSLTDFPERFATMTEARLRLPDDQVKTLAIESVRQHKDLIVIKFAGIDDIDAAQGLRNAVLEIGPDELVELPDGHFFVFDLIGLRVEDDEGQPLGELTQVLSNAANDVYVVKMSDNREVLLPATKEVVLSVDLEKKLMVVKLIPGLLD